MSFNKGSHGQLLVGSIPTVFDCFYADHTHLLGKHILQVLIEAPVRIFCLIEELEEQLFSAEANSILS